MAYFAGFFELLPLAVHKANTSPFQICPEQDLAASMGSRRISPFWLQRSVGDPDRGLHVTCLSLTDGKSRAQKAHRALKEGAESNVQERHSQEACLAFTAASWEGSCSVKAFSEAGDLTSMHRGKREKRGFSHF